MKDRITRDTAWTAGFKLLLLALFFFILYQKTQLITRVTNPYGGREILAEYTVFPR